MRSVTIPALGTGNLHSLLKAFQRVGARASVATDPDAVRSAERLVLPGVGHFGRAMEQVAAAGLRPALEEAVRERHVPVLGICLGMQLLGRHGEEGDAPGLGWVDATAVRFRVSDPIRHKVPQMGWNRIRILKGDSPLLRGIPDGAEFYFAHAYHLESADVDLTSAEAVYEYPFPAAVERGRVFGVQFHPEKSHDAGATLLGNFLDL